MFSDDVSILNNLAFLQVEVKDFKNAAKTFESLHKLQPDELRYATNLAISLAKSGALEQSAAVYESLPKKETPEHLNILLGHAQLLKALNRTSEAFSLLVLHREKYWDEPLYLSVLIDISYASRNDDSASTALQKLIALQKEGKASGLLVPIEPKLLESHVLERQSKIESFNRMLLSGQAPWLMIDGIIGNPSYSAWMIRTQKLPYVFEDPTNWSRFSLYSTNGFYVKQSSTGQHTLVPICAPPKTTPVVLDISALITLHGLGLLTKAAEYFGKIHLPDVYQSLLMRERASLIPHQLSEKSTLETLREAVECGKIRLEDRAPHAVKIFAVVVENAPGNPDAMGLHDLIDLLQIKGSISDIKHAEIVKSLKVPNRKSPTPFAAKKVQSLCIPLPILFVLSQHSVLDNTLNSFVAYVSQDDYRTIQAGVRDFQVQALIRERHVGLWNTVRSDSRFVSTNIPTGSKRTDEEIEKETALAAIRLAETLNLSLFADDRCLQMLRLNKQKGSKFPSFGTDALLGELRQQNIISIAEYSNAFLKLVEWRYRFIIPLPEALKLFADLHKTHPPGMPLIKIGRYVHDCMRDPGLFGGLEPTEPPLPISWRVFHTWLGTIGDFLCSVWSDPEWGEVNAKSLTHWVISEMLPTFPESLNQIELLIPRLLLGRMLLTLPNSIAVARANQALMEISDALKLSKDQYLKLVTGVIHETK